MPTSNEQLRLNARTPRWTPDDDLLLAEATEEGISQAEIADMMGRTEKAVQLRIVRLRGNTVAAAKRSYKSRKAAGKLRRLYKQGSGTPRKRKSPQRIPSEDRQLRLAPPEPVAPVSQAPQQEYGVQVVIVAFVAGLAAGTSLFAIITGAL